MLRKIVQPGLEAQLLAPEARTDMLARPRARRGNRLTSTLKLTGVTVDTNIVSETRAPSSIAIQSGGPPLDWMAGPVQHVSGLGQRLRPNI